MMDLFATALKAAGIAAPSDRVVDGADILPLFTSDAKTPHQAIFGQQGPRLATVRDARWKLHVLAANDHRITTKPGERWIDPRAPDGVTILAPYEQHPPSDYPGAGVPRHSGGINIVFVDGHARFLRPLWVGQELMGTRRAFYRYGYYHQAKLE